MDHAGEFGADKIYAGQLAVLGPKGTGSLPFVPSSGRKVPAEETGALIQHMWDQEKEHLAAFERLIPKHRARPTALLPIWNIAGVYFIYSNNIKSIDSHNCRKLMLLMEKQTCRIFPSTKFYIDVLKLNFLDVKKVWINY